MALCPPNPKSSTCFPWGAGSPEQPLALGCCDTFPLPLLSPPMVPPRCVCGAAVPMPLQMANWVAAAPCIQPAMVSGTGTERRAGMAGPGFPPARWPECPEPELPEGALQGCSPSFGPRQQQHSNEPEVG